MSASDGTAISSIAYFPFGNCRFSQGNLGTDKLFTGQRLDATGLYYYGARYYDATIGRFISPDTEGINFSIPQTLNRYSYCLNNPLNRTDPTGHFSINWKTVLKVTTIVIVAAVVVAAVIIAAPVVLSAISTAAVVAAASTTGVAASAAISVAAGASTAAAVMFPIAAEVAAIPVFGFVATTVANVGLSSIGLGTYNPKLANPTLCPENPSEMDDIIGVSSKYIPDVPGTFEEGGTPGRDKMKWTPNPNLTVTYENHDYDTSGGPQWHTDDHYHFKTPDGYSPGYLPGEPLPYYFWDWLDY